MSPVAPIRFVLVRPAEAGNVGAAARALKNMGVHDLVLVTPQFEDDTEAHRLAHNAADVLEAARHCDSLDAALADCRWSVATTRRLGVRRAPAHTPRSLAAAVDAEPARRPLAVVFGPERDGLTTAEIDLCHDVLHIPAAASQPSLNLAQAVLVVAYELHAAEATAPIPAPAAPDATAESQEEQFAALRDVMLETGFARSETVEHLLRRVRHMLARARPRDDEVALLRGLWRQTLWAVRRHRDGT